MFTGSLRASQIALISSLLLWGLANPVHANPAWADPPIDPDNIAPPPPPATLLTAETPRQTASGNNRRTRGDAARDLAFTYLKLWSAPNRVALASAPAFYGPTVMFHGRTRTLGSVLSEKRRFAERWPDRTYRYRPETTQVACETGGARCTVWSIFDFTAANSRQGRRSRGMGEHELIVSFPGGRPVIRSENSRVLRRGTLYDASSGV